MSCSSWQLVFMFSVDLVSSSTVGYFKCVIEKSYSLCY